MPKDLAQLRDYWNNQSGHYDRSMAFADRKFFGDTREWVCKQAEGDVLEVAIGTGLNLRWYPESIRLTGVELSPQMLRYAQERAEASGRAVELTTGDAQRLDFPDASFDTVVCTFSLCAIPDERRALEQMWRVLRPDGFLLLADHVVSTNPIVRVIQRIIELGSVPIGGEHFRRRPINHVRELGFRIERQERFKAGLVERLVARKPA